MPILPEVVCAAVLGVALLPAVASAESIVYVKDANVWLADAGGSQYQVTTDGTAEHPYRSPSQADDGTIAASTATRSSGCARTARCSTGWTRRR